MRGLRRAATAKTDTFKREGKRLEGREGEGSEKTYLFRGELGDALAHVLLQTVEAHAGLVCQDMDRLCDARGD